MSEGKKIDDGGPAFPLNHGVIVNGKQTCIPTNGMTMREYYAGQAMQGLCASGVLRDIGDYWDGDMDTVADATNEAAKACAALSIMQADALIAALKVTP